MLLASITIEITTYRLDNIISGILLELPVGIEPTLIDYKSIVLPLNYRSIWSKWRESNSHPQLGRLVPWPLCYTCITVPQRHSIIKLNHFIASPRFISLYYIMYLFISCNIFISQGLPYVKTFLIPYVNQSGLSHCPITFSTFRLLNALCGLP